MIRNLPADVTCSGWQTLHMVLRTALTAGYLEDVYLIRLYPRHFYQISRELFSTDLSDDGRGIPFHSYSIPTGKYIFWTVSCLSAEGLLSMLLFSSLRWRNLLISVKYQQTARRHFNLNFDKLSYFGQKCKQGQGQGDRQVLLLSVFSNQHGGFYSV